MELVEPKELIETIAKALVDKPDEVSVDKITGAQVTVLELTVAQEDIGKVIGRGGRTAMAMRTILNAVANKSDRSLLLEIVE